MASTTHIQKIGWGFGRCNMQCRHCYNASGNFSVAHPLYNLKQVADRLCRQHITDINFGTGEFLLNPNALAVARYIRRRYSSVKLGLTTNGYSVVAMKKELLKKLFHDIDVSVDFPNQKKHDHFRQHPLAWQWANRALTICQQLGIERSIVTCVTSRTSDRDILQLISMAQKYDASLRINWFRPTGRGKKELCIGAARFWSIISLLSKHAVFEGLSDPILRAFLSDETTNGHCACGWTSARIQQDLSVTPCVFLKGHLWNSGNILENSLKQTYQHRNFRNIRNRRPPACKLCPHKQVCRGGCASRAYLQAGSLEKPDIYCPMKNKKLLAMIRTIKKNIVIESSEKVHHGYLCTLIIKPKKYA